MSPISAGIPLKDDLRSSPGQNKITALVSRPIYGGFVNKLLAGAVAAGMLTWATAFGDGVATADTALIVPGTAPSPYKPLRSLYHFNPATQPDIGENYIPPDATPRVIPYPGSFWPVTGPNSPTVGQSVNTGTNNLDAAIRSTNGPIYAAGLSQGTLALDAEQARLANDPTAPPPGQLTFVKAGDPNNLLTHVFRPGTHVPIIDYTVPHPVDSQYNTVNIVGQYDIFSDPPDRMGNLLADLNGITAGGYYGHSATAFSDPARVAPGDITTTINDKGATTTTYLIRSDELPLVRALVDMAGLPPEAAGPLNAVLKPMVDRAYGPAPAPLPTPRDITQGAHQVGHIGPAISIPIESTNAGITAGLTAASTAVNAANVVNTVTHVVSGANVANAATHAAANAATPGKGGKGALPLPKIGVLPKGKKLP
jgi:3'-(hydroxy)phthioceranyl-2'-palmitoyl(stearoyl)-2-O-sulfo-trehalose (hydroxy)phthioceranyltransferase